MREESIGKSAIANGERLMKWWFYNFLVLVVSIVLMAALFETICRTVLDTGLQYHLEMWKYAVALKRTSANPEIGHEHVPGSRAYLMNTYVAINNRGLRDREIEAVKPPGTTRILMLGDSIVFGWGVRQDETLPVFLERELKSAGQQKVEVINTGVGNYNTAMEVAYFLEHGVSYTPDVVILNYFINDAEPTPTYSDVPWLERHLYSYAVLGGAWDGFKRRIFGEEQDWRSYYAGLYADGAPGWAKAQASIAKLATYCREHGIRLIVSNIPELHELKTYPFPDVQAKVQAVAAANGVEYVDLLPAVQAEAPESLWVTVPDPHPNKLAQELMAQRLAGYLADHPTAPEYQIQP